MNGNLYIIRNIVFWALTAIFAVLAAFVSGLGRLWGPKLPASVMIYFGCAFFALAALLVLMTLKLKEPGVRRFFLILTGASALAVPICVVLHNLVYGLFFHGKNGDEAVFFILAIFVFPALFVVGSLVSIVFFITSKLKNRTPDSFNRPRPRTIKNMNY